VIHAVDKTTRDISIDPIGILSSKTLQVNAQKVLRFVPPSGEQELT